MVTRWNWILLLPGLLLGTRELRAASRAENSAFASAAKAFQDGLWQRAEAEFASFADTYPQSERAAEAVLLQGRARFEQKKFADAITLLQDKRGHAGNWANRYLYWIGEARFESGDFQGAAECFSELERAETNAVSRLEANVGEAAARARLGQWPRVGEMLGTAGSVFQATAQNSPENPLVTRGLLLLAEARLAQNDSVAAEKTLRPLENRWLDPEQAWQRQQLRTRIALNAGQLGDAEKLAGELDALAKATGRGDFAAESVALLAQIFEGQKKLDEAIAAYQRNLVADAPVQRQREALAKIVDLALAQGRPELAELTLEKFLSRFPDSPAVDVALLTVGELQLKRCLATISASAPETGGAATNFLEKGLLAFNRLISAATNSPFLGRAQLDRGWCLWYLGNRTEESLAAFKRAAGLLAPSKDLAVAQLKAGDAHFRLGDYSEARGMYSQALETAAHVPEAQAAIGDFAASQLVRTCRELKDLECAERGMKLILSANPRSAMAEEAWLQVAQGYTDLSQPKKARELYAQFLEAFPSSAFRPQIELAIARTEEQSGELTGALARYDRWLQDNPTNDLRPKVEFYRAMALARARQETNALPLFTNLVTQYPSEPLAVQAQWWVADQYFSQGDWANAERNYIPIFRGTNWAGNQLSFEALMMAGRCAVARVSYDNAIEYFTNLTSSLKCPPGLRLQALFAYGQALMLRGTGTNQVEDLRLAREVFGKIPQISPTSEHAALAWGEIGNCNQRLGAFDPLYYDEAIKAYGQVTNASAASASARCEAKVGIGQVLEKQAEKKSSDEAKALLDAALNQYLDVVYENVLREGELRDDFWVKKAGLEALRLTESIGQSSPEKLIRRLEQLLPALRPSLEKRLEGLQTRRDSAGE